MAAQATSFLAAASTLAGRRFVVADDDPATTWYFTGVLRSRGAIVEEALDGDAAYERIVDTLPEVVLADVRMPGIAGKEMTRVLADDVVMRDVAVVLLSWKADWLARAIEQGVGAAGYLPKRATPEGTLACVRRVLARREHLESRLAGIATVRGMLEGVTPHRLLSRTAALRPNARVSIHDGTSLHELQLRDGAPVSALRTSLDGAVARGPAILASMLALRTGRFVVATDRGPVAANLEGELGAQLAGAVEWIRRGPEVLEPTATLSTLPPVVEEGASPMAEGPEPTADEPEPMAEAPEPTTDAAPQVADVTEPIAPAGPTEPLFVSTLRLIMPPSRAKTPPPRLALVDSTEPILPFPRNVRRPPVVVKRPAQKPALRQPHRAATILLLIAAGIALGVGMSDTPHTPTHAGVTAPQAR